MTEDRREVYRRLFRDLKRKREEGGIPWWRTQVGKNMVRILPNWKNPKLAFYKQVLVHWNVGENERKLNCRRMLGEDADCPICDFVDELRKSSSVEDIRYGDSMACDERYAMNILDGSDKDKLARGPQVFECGRGLFQDILWMFTEGDFGDLDDYKEGRYILIERTGTGQKDTRYSVMPAAKESPVDPDVIKEKINDLDEVYKPMSVDDIVAILEGQEPGEAAQSKEEQEAEKLAAREPEQPAPAKAKPSEKQESKGAEIAPPSEEDFKKEDKKAEEKNKPVFSRSEKVDERLRRLKRPSDTKK